MEDMEAAETYLMEQFPNKKGWAMALWLLRKTHPWGNVIPGARAKFLGKQVHRASGGEVNDEGKADEAEDAGKKISALVDSNLYSKFFGAAEE
jgi:hypothetical protein